MIKWPKMKKYLRHSWKPALLLVLLTPLPEALSGAMSLTGLLSPAIFIPFALFLYGVPILIIREIAVRKQLGLVGLGCLGVVYALYNEGLFAQTLFYPFDAPLSIYASYGVIGDVRIPFMLFIGAWHALISVVLPVVLIHYLFRTKAAEPWLSKRTAWILGGGVATLAVAGFFGLGREADEYIGSPSMALVYGSLLFFIGLLLWFAAARLSRVLRVSTSTVASFSWRPFIYGVLLFVFIDVIPFGLADSKIYWPIFALYFLILSAVGIRMAIKRPSISLDRATTFVLGAGMAAALVALTAGNILAGLLFGIIFASLLFRIKRRSKKNQLGNHH